MFENLDKYFNGAPASEFFLGNGFSVLHARNAAFKSAAVRLCVRTGSLDEGRFSGTGISHFVEHMVFNGAGPLDKRGIASAVNDIGGSMNAYTFYDRTVYSLDCPSDGLFKAFEILADMAFAPHMGEADFTLERDVILREIDMCADDPDDVLFNGLCRRAYAKHPMRYPIIGEKAAFKSLTLADLREYMQIRYAPCNMFLTVVSDLSDAKIKSLAQKFFGRIPFGRCGAALRETEPAQTSPRKIIMESDAELAKASLAYKLPPANDALSEAVLDAFAHTLADGNASVLVRKLKYGESLADSVECEVLRAGDIKLLLVNWECRPENNDKMKARVLEEIGVICEEGLGEVQIARYARHCVLQQANALRNSSAFAEWLSTLRLDGLDAGSAKYGMELLRKSSARKISEILKGLIFEEASTYAVSSPKVRAGKTKRARAENAGEFECATLSNGLRVVLKKIDYMPKVHIRISSVGGLQNLDPKLRGKLGLASLAVLRDTSARTAEELAEFTEENGLSFSSEFGNSLCSLSAESLDCDARKIFGITGDALLRLKINPKTLATEKSALISDILGDSEDPQYLALRALRREFFGKYSLAAHPDGEIADIKSATAADVEKILKKNFFAQNSVLCVCGNFEKSEILDDCEKYFSSLPSCKGGCDFNAAASELKARKSASVEVKTGRAQSVAFAAYEDFGTACKGHFAARSVLLEMLGGEDGVVFERVREREGLAYSAGFARVSDFCRAMVCFNAASSKNNLARIQKLFGEIAEDFRSGRFEAERMESAKNMIKSRFMANSQDPSAWSAAAAYSALAFGAPQTAENVFAQIDAVRAEDVARYARLIFKNPLVFNAL